VRPETRLLFAEGQLGVGVQVLVQALQRRVLRGGALLNRRDSRVEGRPLQRLALGQTRDADDLYDGEQETKRSVLWAPGAISTEAGTTGGGGDGTVLSSSAGRFTRRLHLLTTALLLLSPFAVHCPLCGTQTAGLCD